MDGIYGQIVWNMGSSWLNNDDWSSDDKFWTNVKENYEELSSKRSRQNKRRVI